MKNVYVVTVVSYNDGEVNVTNDLFSRLDIAQNHLKEQYENFKSYCDKLDVDEFKGTYFNIAQGYDYWVNGYINNEEIKGD